MRGGGGGGGRRMGTKTDDAKTVKIAPDRRAIAIIVACAVLESILVPLLWGLSSDKMEENPRLSTFDLMIIGLLKNAIALGAMYKEMRSVYYCTLAVSIALYVSKVVMFNWKAAPGTSVTILLVAFFSAALQFAMSPWALGSERKAIPTFKAIRVILQPYFTPKGFMNRVRVLLTWACIIGTKVCNLYTPLIMGLIITDLGKPEKPYGKIILYILLSLAAKGLPQLQSSIYVKVKQTAFIEMSEKVFSHVHSLSLEWHLRKKMGDVVRYMDRGTAAADSVVSYLFLFFLPTIGECIATFIIFYHHFSEPTVTGICMLSFNLYMITTYFLTTWRRTLREGMNQHDNDYHNKTTESLVNFETVKYFTAEHRERESFLTSVQEYQKYGVTNQLTLSGLNFAQSMIIQLCRGSCMFITATSVYNGSLSIGDFVAMNAFVMQLFAPLSFMGSLYNSVVMAFVNMQHLAELLSEQPDVKDIPGAVPLALPGSLGPTHAVNVCDESDEDDENVELMQRVEQPASRCSSIIPTQGVDVSFEGISFKYPSADAGKGIKDITFTAAAGQKVALVGHTGCGKTTLSRLLFRFYNLDTGVLRINGQDVSKLQQRSVRCALGIVPQDTTLFNTTIKENIMYGDPDATEEEMLQAAKDAQLMPVIDRLPSGWDTVVGERGLRLSGGEKQRVAIARCLLKNPPIIVLDEATSALDSNTEKEILEVLQCLAGRTLLVIAHRLSTIQDSDLIVVLKEGTIAEMGKHQDLMLSKGLYHEMWKTQENTFKEEEHEQKSEE
eukprot:TRINITY_DN21487_c0_g1_i1.p1 TRINITY_DN21487_c0_g1~~TRINITY_DN21487_c0_g1_i1.p1  ORF type:complete len:793 (+),score=149.52 TRINITY_DN21487_c0_g1_i1:37-2379(+)